MRRPRTIRRGLALVAMAVVLLLYVGFAVWRVRGVEEVAPARTRRTEASPAPDSPVAPPGSDGEEDRRETSATTGEDERPNDAVQGAAGVSGVVLGPDGEPVRSAEVFLLPKAYGGPPPRRPERTSTDSGGKWSFPDGYARGHWIWARHGAHVAVRVDGDAAAGPDDVVLRLGRGREITLALRGAREGATVRFLVSYDETAPDGAPPNRQSAVLTFENGFEDTLPIGTNGPIRVRPNQRSAGGLAVEPWEVVLGPKEDHATFVLERSCSFRVRYVGVDSSFWGSSWVHWELYDGDTMVTGGQPRDAHGELVVRDGIPPGRYRLRHRVLGHTLHENEIVLGGYGAHAELEVETEPLPAQRRKRTWFEWASGDTPSLTPNAVFRRTDAAHGRWHTGASRAASIGGSSQPPRVGFSTTELDAEYEVIIVERSGARVAYAPRLHWDGVTPVVWEEGVVVDLAGALEPGEHLRDPVLRSERLGAMPLYRVTPRRQGMIGASLFARGAKLGPYPSGLRLTLEGTRIGPDGRETRFSWAID